MAWGRANHSHRSSFIGDFEELVAGVTRAPEPSSLEQAKARWAGER